VSSIDFVARWRAMTEARHDQGRRLDTRHRRSDAWAGGRAQRFSQHVLEGRTDDPLLTRLLAVATPDTTVLDVGGGTGRHAIPLARVARAVTVVEPSLAMREQLRANADREALTNVSIVEAEWPAARHLVQPADLVVCSHVLYPVVEVEPFLRALDEVARQAVYLAMRTGQREGPYLGLFEQVWGEPRALAATSINLFNVAHQLGFPAEFRLVPFPSWRTFADVDDAVSQVRADLLNPVDAGVEPVIRAFLADRLKRRDGPNGALGFQADAAWAGVVSWKKETVL